MMNKNKFTDEAFQYREILLSKKLHPLSNLLKQVLKAWLHEAILSYRLMEVEHIAILKYITILGPKKFEKNSHYYIIYMYQVCHIFACDLSFYWELIDTDYGSMRI